MGLAAIPIIFAAMAGYFACFWPGKSPVHRMVTTVLLPATLGLSLICGGFYYLNRPSSSLLESGFDAGYRSAISFAAISARLGPGLHYCVLGIILILIFAWRLFYGNSSLPLTMAEPVYLTVDDAESWRRLSFLVWVLLGPLSVLFTLASLIIISPYIFSSHLPPYVQNPWFVRASPILEAAAALCFALYVMGPAGRQVVRKSIRFPKAGVAFLALAIPLGIASFISTGQYFFDRAQWVAHNLGNNFPPAIGTYFDLPDPWLLLAFFPALFEEIVFRGWLHQRFIQRYGVNRGIFLVAIVWAAFHFYSDTHSRESDLEVLWSLVFRIIVCLALGYVLSWMTLRSATVLPAAFAHTLYNVLVWTGFGPAFRGKGLLRIGLWALLGYVLFHYWPVPGAEEQETEGAIPEPEITS